MTSCRPQPTAPVHFGDRQPPSGAVIRTLRRTPSVALRPYRHYLTGYMTKRNFAGAPLPRYPMPDIAFLPAWCCR